MIRRQTDDPNPPLRPASTLIGGCPEETQKKRVYLDREQIERSAKQAGQHIGQLEPEPERCDTQEQVDAQ
jgi:hypothetical protein